MDLPALPAAHLGSWMLFSSDALFLVLWALSLMIILLFCNNIYYLSKLNANEQHCSFFFSHTQVQSDTNCFVYLHAPWGFLMLLKNKTFTHSTSVLENDIYQRSPNSSCTAATVVEEEFRYFP